MHYRVRFRKSRSDLLGCGSATAATFFPPIAVFAYFGYDIVPRFDIVGMQDFIQWFFVDISGNNRRMVAYPNVSVNINGNRFSAHIFRTMTESDMRIITYYLLP